MEKVLPGKIICPGLAVGQAHVLLRNLEVPRVRIGPQRVEQELERYTQAVGLAREHLQEHVSEAHCDAGKEARQIIGIHELMLADEVFHESVRSRVSRELLCPEWALAEETEQATARLEASGDPYLQARVEDVWDMAHNLLSALSAPASAYAVRMNGGGTNQIVVTGNLFLSEVMRAKTASACGLASASRALTSHAAIVLKSFNIPSLGAVEDLEEQVHPGDTVILDALNGRLVVRPAAATVQEYLTEQRRLRRSRPGAERSAEVTRTIDGSRVTLLANIDHAGQMDLALRNRLEGIGLFRTEFLLLDGGQIPGEQEQYDVYRRIMETMKGRRVVIRTFDLGADKRLPCMDRCLGQNPSLGIRGIRRHLLRRPDELRTQLRAVLRAFAGASVDVLLPMVTTAEDVRSVKNLLGRIAQELRHEGMPFCETARLGAMIEVPAAAFAIQAILAEVDFASLGTNDLIQYFTAADRDNEAVQHYGDLRNGAVLLMLRHVAEQAVGIGRAADLAICGEAASAPENVGLLLQMGYRTLSISPVMAQAIRAAVEATRL